MCVWFKGWKLEAHLDRTSGINNEKRTVYIFAFNKRIKTVCKEEQNNENKSIFL